MTKLLHYLYVNSGNNDVLLVSIVPSLGIFAGTSAAVSFLLFTCYDAFCITCNGATKRGAFRQYEHLVQ